MVLGAGSAIVAHGDLAVIREGREVARVRGATVVAPIIVSAGLYAAAFPPLALAALAWVALGPFFAGVCHLSPARAAACGLLWGVLVQAGTAWWFPGTLAAYWDVPAWVGVIGFLLCATFLVGIYTAAFAAWLAWLARAGGASPLAVAAGFTAMEFIRAQCALGIPWALSGYTQVPWSAIMQVADLGGPYAVAFLIAAINACAAAWWRPDLRGPHFRAQVAATTALVVLAVGYGHLRLAQTFTAGEPAAVVLVQSGIARRPSDGRAESRARLERHLELTQAAIVDSRPALVLWPEFAIDFFLQEDTNERRRLQAALGADAGDVLIGGPHYGARGTQMVQHNSVFLWRAGAIAGRYDKVEPLPFAERSIFGVGARRRSGRGASSFAPGDAAVLLPSRIGSVAVLLCSEGMDPARARQAAVEGAGVLVNPSNDAWFGSELAARQQLDVASVRAIENRRYLLRSTSTAYSAVVDPHGRVVARSPFGSADVVAARIATSPGVWTLYQRIGDLPSWLLLAIAAVTTFASRSRRTR